MTILNHIEFEDIRLLNQKYAEPHRYYHNLSHCSAVFEYAGIIDEKESKRENSNHNDCLFTHVNRKRFFQFAAAWHDVIYDVRSKENEELSAQVWERSQTSLKFSRATVAQAIRATANHFDPVHDSSPYEIQVFLDADLYELGSDPVLFDLNGKNILNEYIRNGFTEKECLEGRINWITRVLDGPRIFRIAVDREEPARANLLRSLSQLREQLGT